jgi:hypothetical protein
MQQLTEQQVRHWIDSIFACEGPEDGEHSLSPVARAVTLALADLKYVPTYSSFEFQHGNPELRKFRAFLCEVSRVMDDCGVKPWTAADEEKVSP